jgi:hypothetical protein
MKPRTETAEDVEARLQLFRHVRAVPYATDGAHDAASLLSVGRGDCLAKSAFLAREMKRLGLEVRRVRWLYLLLPWPPEVGLLPSREDVHTAVEVWLGRRWVLIDATHDPPLAAAGLTVADWDGRTDTAPAYRPTGPLWREGDATPEPSPNPAASVPFSPEAGRRYQAAFNRWLTAARTGTAHTPPPPGT